MSCAAAYARERFPPEDMPLPPAHDGNAPDLAEADSAAPWPAPEVLAPGGTCCSLSAKCTLVIGGGCFEAGALDAFSAGEDPVPEDDECAALELVSLPSVTDDSSRVPVYSVCVCAWDSVS